MEMLKKRKGGEGGGLSEELFEWLLEQFETHSRFQHINNHHNVIKTSKYKLSIITNNNNNKEVSESRKDEDAFCCICGDGDGSFCNNILFCELCNIAVHQVRA